MVKVRGMRPAFLPRWLGQRFVLVGFRVFARHRDASGRVRRGLRILESRTDRRALVAMGNLLTHYKYRRARVDWQLAAEGLQVRLGESGGDLTLDVLARTDGEAPLPATSPFLDWQQARRFAGPLPWTFDYDASYAAALLTAFASVLMVSDVQYEKSNIVSLRYIRKTRRIIKAAIILLSLLFFPQMAFFAWGLLYIIYGAVRSLYYTVRYGADKLTETEIDYLV